MPLSQQMKELADKIFISELEPIRRRNEEELQQVIRSSATQGLSPVGIVHKQFAIHEKALREISTTRLDSCKKVLEQAKEGLAEADIQIIVEGIGAIADARIGSIVFEADLLVKRTNTPFDLSWLKPSLGRVKSSIIANISRNLEIDRQMVILAQTAGRDTTGKFAFIIMSFNPLLDFLYRDALVPAVTDCDLQPYKVNEQEFDGTITEAILHNIRNCRVVVADLTDERPNCYFELGYAIALGKPVVVAAREDHDPRRDLRKPGDPKVHFDLDSHQITYWVREDMNQLRQQLATRIKKCPP